MTTPVTGTEPHKTHHPITIEDDDPTGDDSLNIGSSSDSFQRESVTKDELQKLYTKIKNEHLTNEKDLLKILDEATTDLENGDIEGATELYDEVLSEDPAGTGGADNEEGNGNPRHRVENGVNIFEAVTPLQDFELIDTGDGSTNRVATDGNVTLKPIDPNKDTVNISSDDTYYIVELTHDGKKSTWQIDKSKVKSLHIAISKDKVTGDIHNSKSKVTVGYKNNELFISQDRLKDIVNKINGSVDKIGGGVEDVVNDDDHHYYSFHTDTYTYGVGKNYQAEIDHGVFGGNFLGAVIGGLALGSVGAVTAGILGDAGAYDPASPVGQWQAIAKDVKDILSVVAKAIQAKDPTEKKNLWNQVNDTLVRWKTQDQTKGNSTNDKAQLLFDVLYGELGEKDFIQAMGEGILPTEFTQKLTEGLEANHDETNKIEEIDGYQHGGPGWTHGSTADFLKKYSNSVSDAGSGDQ